MAMMIDLFQKLKAHTIRDDQMVPVDLIIAPKGQLVGDPNPLAQNILWEPKFYKINNRFIPIFEDKSQALKLSYDMFVKGIPVINGAEVREIKMSAFLPYIEFEEETGLLRYYELTGAFSSETIEDVDFVNFILTGTPYDYEISAESMVAEEVLDDLDAGFSVTTDTGFKELEFIEEYLKMNPTPKPDPMVPMLVGHTGIAKSAIIIDAAKRFGMRIIDIRCAFVDKTDVEGFVQIIPERNAYEQAPMKELIMCTDGFVEQAREFVEKHRGEKFPEKSDDKKVYDAMVEYAKTPILFFDEINRAPNSVKQTLLNILNKKELLQYKMTYARVVAAANVPVFNQGIDDWEMQKFYVESSIDDAALLARFVKIPVNPRDPVTYNGWIAWAENQRKPPLESEILDFLKQSPNRGYDLSPYKKPGIDTHSQAVKITTYRGWEQFNDYFEKTIKPNKTFNRTMVTNILGETDVANLWIEHMKDTLGYSERGFKEDLLTDAIDEGLDAGLPVLLVSGTGMGKSTRVREYAKKRKWEYIEVELSRLDRTMTRGVPDPQETALEVLPSGSFSFDEEGKAVGSKLGVEVANMTKSNAKLPIALTAFRKNVLMLDKIEAAISKKPPVPLLIFFDEVNRVQNPVVMTAVFEAISNNRFFGIDLPERVRVVAACNLPRQATDADLNNPLRATYRVSPIDPAFTARFLVARKDQMDESDYKSYIKYIKDSDEHGNPHLDPSLVHVMEKLGYKKFKKMVDLVESIDQVNNIPTPRAFEMLSNIITGSSLDRKYMRGFLISISENQGLPDDQEIIDKMNDPDWTGNSDWEIEIELPAGSGNKKMVKGKDIRDTFIAKGGSPGSKLLLLQYEAKVREKRSSVFERILGKGSAGMLGEIVGAYNTAEQGRIIRIEDLTPTTGVKLAKKYFFQQIGNKIDRPKIARLIADVLEHYVSSYQEEDIYDVIAAGLDLAPSTDDRDYIASELKDNPKMAAIGGMQFSNEIRDKLALLFNKTTL